MKKTVADFYIWDDSICEKNKKRLKCLFLFACTQRKVCKEQERNSGSLRGPGGWGLSCSPQVLLCCNKHGTALFIWKKNERQMMALKFTLNITRESPRVCPACSGKPKDQVSSVWKLHTLLCVTKVLLLRERIGETHRRRERYIFPSLTKSGAFLHYPIFFFWNFASSE